MRFSQLVMYVENIYDEYETIQEIAQLLHTSYPRYFPLDTLQLFGNKDIVRNFEIPIKAALADLIAKYNNRKNAEELLKLINQNNLFDLFKEAQIGSLLDIVDILKTSTIGLDNPHKITLEFFKFFKKQVDLFMHNKRNQQLNNIGYSDTSNTDII